MYFFQNSPTGHTYCWIFVLDDSNNMESHKYLHFWVSLTLFNVYIDDLIRQLESGFA